MKAYFRRYMRVTPILAVLLLAMFSSANLLPSAPYFFPKSGLETCKKYWWTQMIHVQNYVNFSQPVIKLQFYAIFSFQQVVATSINLNSLHICLPLLNFCLLSSCRNFDQPAYYILDCSPFAWLTLLFSHHNGNNFLHCFTKTILTLFQCNPVTWYLSVDFQLFLLTPFVIYSIKRWKWISFLIFPSLIAAVQCLTFVETVRIEGFLRTMNL